ncbi:MAG: polysaccharide biosynthesis/export family protein [Bryobacteraceae bacterium]
MRVLTSFVMSLLFSAWYAFAAPGEPAARGYVLAADDAVTIHVADIPELDSKALGIVRVDHQGNIRIPLAGRIQAAGFTVEGLEKEIAAHLSNLMNEPQVSVAVAEYRSHPVSVLGSVRSPGVYQVSGRKTLFEVLSLAGGLNPDASNKINLTRQVAAGTLPLPNATKDKTGDFYIGELNVRSVMEAKNPQENIEVLSNDVITVPKAELVYVVGAVKRPGGFPLAEKEGISILQAVSLAEGLDRVAAAKRARILRQVAPGSQRTELNINVGEILDGRAQDIALRANDILFIPTSVAKSASIRALEAALQAGTGIAIYGR